VFLTVYLPSLTVYLPSLTVYLPSLTYLVKPWQKWNLYSKKVASTEFSDYRPIYLLTSFCKIIEKIMNVRMYLYLNVNNIFDNEQFGFREKSFTDMATHYLLNTV
jgi:hypothetical protein